MNNPNPDLVADARGYDDRRQPWTGSTWGQHHDEEEEDEDDAYYFTDIAGYLGENDW